MESSKQHSTCLLLLTVVLLLNRLLVRGSEYECDECECDCPKPKTRTKYVVVEIPKYIPVKKTKYVPIKVKEEYSMGGGGYDRRR